MERSGANDISKDKNIITKVLKDIKEASSKYDLINKGDHIVFGLSGGPDSVCLFFAFYMLKDELGITLSAVHINHKLRPGAAENDQKYVEELCERLGIRQTSVVRDCNAVAKEYGLTSEEAGRQVRYLAFDEEADYIVRNFGKSKEQVKIAVAHNAGDQAETMLFRLMRGTGTDGLAGIERKRLSNCGYTIIRPILGIARSDIEAFCEAIGLEPRIDHTNSEPIYARNKIRLGLIPYIEENFNENIIEALNRLAAIAGDDKDYIRCKTDEAYAAALIKRSRSNDAPSEIIMSLEALQNEHKAIRSRIILKAFSELGLSRDIGAQHIEAADNLIARATTGKTAEFPYGYSMVVRYDKIAFKAPEAAKNAENTEIQQEMHGLPAEYINGDAEKARNTDICRACGSGGWSMTARLVPLHEWNVYSIEHRNMPKNFAAFDCDMLCESKGIRDIEKYVSENSDSSRSSGEAISIGALNLEYRTRKPGDYIKLASGTKKLQDFFVDSKIPRDLRDKIHVAAVGNEILWIPGADSIDTVKEIGVTNKKEAASSPFWEILPNKGRYSSNYSVSNITKMVIILELTQKL